jgi:malate dehydrogenase (oxaloacetate-decarboxylating)(NADP+)
VHREHVENVIGLAPGVKSLYAMSLLLLPDRTLFIADTYINYEPTAEQLVDMTLLAADDGSPLRCDPARGAPFAFVLWFGEYADGLEDA